MTASSFKAMLTHTHTRLRLRYAASQTYIALDKGNTRTKVK